MLEPSGGFLGLVLGDRGLGFRAIYIWNRGGSWVEFGVAGSTVGVSEFGEGFIFLLFGYQLLSFLGLCSMLFSDGGFG